MSSALATFELLQSHELPGVQAVSPLSRSYRGPASVDILVICLFAMYN